jgi:hypothetical protein
MLVRQKHRYSDSLRVRNTPLPVAIKLRVVPVPVTSISFHQLTHLLVDPVARTKQRVDANNRSQNIVYNNCSLATEQLLVVRAAAHTEIRAYDA